MVLPGRAEVGTRVWGLWPEQLGTGGSTDRGGPAHGVAELLEASLAAGRGVGQEENPCAERTRSRAAGRPGGRGTRRVRPESTAARAESLGLHALALLLDAAAARLASGAA